ncbi:hypothetical protein [Maridesulfovibrio sp.]|uniref:hypothetical protein n=1 Tax=Maridesulfovibrio sp. TaxID=2795000 RepID=UPI0029CA440A|nr:hypothetical protein [Maridesulfovibrio sp.]
MDAFIHSAWWGPIGLLSTLIFGFLSIYIVIKNWYPCRITYMTAQIIELFDAVGNTLDGLEVNYKENNIDQNLVLLTGAFLNSGKKDITKDMIESPIEISLPNDYKWLTAKIIKNKIEANISIKDDKIKINTGLFRKGECVRFNALVQVPSDNSSKTLSSRLKSALKFNHRISNTHKIKTDTIKNKDAHTKMMKRRCVLIGSLLLMTWVTTGISLYQGLPQTIYYPYQTNNSTEDVFITTKPTGSMIKITSIQSDFEKEVEFTTFLENQTGTPTLNENSKSKKNYFIILLAIQNLLPLILIFMLLYEFLSNRKKLKIIGEL